MKNDSDHGFPEQEGKDTPEPTERDAPGQNVNPDLTFIEKKRGTRPGDNFVRRRTPYRHLFRGSGGNLVATSKSSVAESRPERAFQTLKATFIGTPLYSKDEVLERLSKFKALAIFGSDAISSSAYATQAALVVLMVAGNSALSISFYAALAIAALLLIVSFSFVA